MVEITAAISPSKQSVQDLVDKLESSLHTTERDFAKSL